MAKKAVTRPDLPDPYGFRLEPHIWNVYLAILDMPPNQRAAFAASCCERLYPAYKSLATVLGSKDDVKYRRLLDVVWAHALGTPLSRAEAERHLKVCRSLELGEEEACPEWIGGMNAVGALLAALHTCVDQDSASYAAKAARCGTERIFQTLFDAQVGEGPKVLQPDEVNDLHDRVDKHPQMMAEVQLQNDAIRFLRERKVLTPSDIDKLR